MEVENRREVDSKASHKVEGLNLLDLMGVGSKYDNAVRPFSLANAGKEIADDFAIVGQTVADEFGRTGKSLTRELANAGVATSKDVREYLKTLADGIATAETNELVSAGKPMIENVGRIGQTLANDIKTHGPELAEFVKDSAVNNPLIVPSIVASGALAGMAVAVGSSGLVGLSCISVASVAATIASSELGHAMESVTGNIKIQSNPKRR
ncbi:MAG: hypothetical protein K2X93_28895 [Candidatus Obscuribacterales bacterium]|nr:hypothetical protein [Candidatus Obscuribacterales bacterium]